MDNPFLTPLADNPFLQPPPFQVGDRVHVKYHSHGTMGRFEFEATGEIVKSNDRDIVVRDQQGVQCYVPRFWIDLLERA